MKKEELKQIIDYEKSQYFEKFKMSPWEYFKASFFKEPICGIIRWQVCSRKCDYYSGTSSIIGRIIGQYFRFLRNYYGRMMNIEASTSHIGKGLILYHSGGIIINASAQIGENVHFHGANCVGNSGEENDGCPIIGNNVSIGVGAKIIGNIEIADGITIGAGAVVVKSFFEPNITIAGVPAHKIS